MGLNGLPACCKCRTCSQEQKGRVKGGSAPPPSVAQSLCQWSTDEQHRSRSGAFRAIFISALFQLAVLKDACLIFTWRLWTAGQLQVSYEVTAETPVHTGV